MSARLHAKICWLLAWFVIAQSVSFTSGLVLCIEEDGSASIETAAEQLACLGRQESAGRPDGIGAGGSGAGLKLSVPPACVDIPLCLGAVKFTTPILHVSVPRLANLCVLQSAAGATTALEFLTTRSQAHLYSPSPPSGALAALQSVILVV